LGLVRRLKKDRCILNVDLAFIGWTIEPSDNKILSVNKDYAARLVIENKGANKINNDEIRYYTHSNGAPSKFWKVDLEPGEKKEFEFRFKYLNKYNNLSYEITLDEFNKMNDSNRRNNIFTKQIKE